VSNQAEERGGSSCPEAAKRTELACFEAGK